jgi:predicted metal-dependent hydrolase
VARLARDRRVEPALRECLDGMMREEEAHLRMFLALNRHARPDLYADGESCFRRLGGGDRLALGLAMRASSRLPFLLFFVIALEELSAGLSRAMLKEREDPELGPLEENFVRVHGEHLKDEARHVHLDVHLIRAMYVGSWRLTRRINAALLAAFFENAMVPRRGGLAVLRRLFAERPELKPQAPAMEAQLLALGHDTAFHASLFSRELAPHTFALFDALPEMAALEGVLKSYARA